MPDVATVANPSEPLVGSILQIVTRDHMIVRTPATPAADTATIGK